MVKLLLALGDHADKIRGDRKTNIMFCAEHNYHDVAKIISDNYCNPNSVNKKGESAFWAATYLKNIETAAILCNHSANMDILSNTGETILHFSYKNKKNDIFYFLLGLGASASVKDKENEKVLFKVFRNKDDRVAELIQDRFNGDINTQTTNNNTLAHLAILEKDYDRLKYYIKREINIEIKNNKGYSILMISIVMFNDLELCNRLIQINSNINTQDLNGNTPLLNILHSQNVNRRKFDFLLEHNCNINIQNSVGEIPLSVCIIRGFDNEAKILLDKGSSINNKNSQNEPIVNALKVKSKFWFETLLLHGANYINSDFFNFDRMKLIPLINITIGAPIHAALRKNYFEVVQYLWVFQVMK